MPNDQGLQIMLTFSAALIIGVGIGILGFILGRLLAPSRNLERKRLRYECGNPPRGRARGLFMMQYYPYLIVFLTVEPVMIYSFLLLMEAHSSPSRVLLLFLIILGIITPPLVFGLNSARRLKLWSAE